MSPVNPFILGQNVKGQGQPQKNIAGVGFRTLVSAGCF